MWIYVCYRHFQLYRPSQASISPIAQRSDLRTSYLNILDLNLAVNNIFQFKFSLVCLAFFTNRLSPLELIMTTFKFSPQPVLLKIKPRLECKKTMKILIKVKYMSEKVICNNRNSSIGRKKYYVINTNLIKCRNWRLIISLRQFYDHKHMQNNLVKIIYISFFIIFSLSYIFIPVGIMQRIFSSYEVMYCIQGKFRPRYIFAFFALWFECEFKTGPSELYMNDCVTKLESGRIQDCVYQFQNCIGRK